MTNITPANPVLNADIAAQLNITPATTLKAKQTRPRPTTGDKAATIAKSLVDKAIIDGALCYCPITGLLVSHDLPPSLDVLMINCHPLAINAIRLLDHPAYIQQFDNGQLAGLILGLLAEVDKISISPRSNAFLVRAKLETIASRNQLLDIIEWIANSLLTTKLYYPKLAISHDKLTIQALDEYMAWTYSIEVYSFDGSKPELVKAPKPLAVVSPATKVNRLSKSFDSSLDELVQAIDSCPDTTIEVVEATSEAILLNLSPLLKGKAADPNSKLDGLLAALSSIEAIADIVADMQNYRQAISQLVGTQTTAIESILADYMEAPEPAPVAAGDKPASQIINPFLAKLAAAKVGKS